MDKPKTILVCPLDWGLGHATRCIPLIKKFLEEGNKVIIGSSGKQEALLKKEFPAIQFIPLKGYEVAYPKKGSMIAKMLFQIPKITKAIAKEHQWLKQILKEYKVDMVVSDNRYGLWNKKVKSIIVTHQIFIKSPFGERLLEHKTKKYLNNFDEVWIPDVDGKENLSGDLAHKNPLPDNYKYIGIQSRFSNQSITSSVQKDLRTYREEELNKNCHPEFNRRINNFEFDFMSILSGPEPQRSIFEKLILEQVKHTQLKGIIVRGLPNSDEKLKIDNSKILVFNHLETEEFLNYIEKSKVVISRSGYSTIMDLVTLGKKAILVPTPGQSEQEYLAKYHHNKSNFTMQKQSEFDLVKGIELIKIS